MHSLAVRLGAHLPAAERAGWLASSHGSGPPSGSCAMDSVQLLERGFLPEALPLAFTTANFAAIADSLQRADDGDLLKEWAEPTPLNVARPGGLRRRMSIVNPFKQRLLSLKCTRDWSTLEEHMRKSSISLTKPRPHESTDINRRGLRYLQYEMPRGGRAASRSAILGGTRYTLQTDISNFYGSVYTHSIDWALSSKLAAKSNARQRVPTLGGMLDSLVRNGQDGQTKGIPVGPDTSHLLAELLLCELDSALEREHPAVASRGLRYIDDFDFAARSFSEAEAVLQTWDSILASWELALNPLKTRIVEGPLPPEPQWKIELRQHPLRDETPTTLANDLRSVFSLAIRTSITMPGTPALTYAVRRAAEVATSGVAWEELQNLLLGAITTEPSCLPRVYELVARTIWRGQLPDGARFADVLNEFCTYHAPLEHGSEVTWGLYLIHRLGLSVDSVAAQAVLKMKDNCSLLLLRDLDSRKRIDGQAVDWSDVVSRAEATEGPTSSDWLLAYEFARNGWANGASFTALPYWKELLTLDVAFFESPPPLGPSPNRGIPQDAARPPIMAEPSSDTVGWFPEENNGVEVEPGTAEDSPEVDPPSPESAPSNLSDDNDDNSMNDADSDLDEVELLSFLGSDRY